MRDSRKTKLDASGHWLAILRDLAPALHTAIDKVGDHVPCPLGTGDKDGFRLFKDADLTGGGVSNSCGIFSDGFNLLMWVNDWKFPETHDAVFEWLNGVETKSVKTECKPNKKDITSNAANAQKRRVLLNKLWSESHRLERVEADIAMSYLAKRRCFPLPWSIPDLAFHESLQYRMKGEKSRLFPGLVAVVRDSAGHGVSLHRTFLSLDGNKAPVDKPKRLMPVPDDATLSGGAIRLQPADWRGEVIGVAEGIETALAVSCATHMVCWSTMSSTLLANFLPPQWVKKVVIWADRDREKIIIKNGEPTDVGSAGQRAAYKLQEKLWRKGVEAEIRLPPASPLVLTQKSIDWADMYAKYGAKPFFHESPKRWA